MIRMCILECKRRHCFQFTAHVQAYIIVSFCSIAWLKSPQNGECNISIISYFWEINGNYTSLIFHTQRLQVCKITPKTNMIFPMEFWCWVFRQAGMGENQSWRSLEIVEKSQASLLWCNLRFRSWNLRSLRFEIITRSSSGQITWKKSLLTSIFLGESGASASYHFTSLKMNGWNLNMPTWKRKDHLSEPNLQESGFRIKFQGCTCGSMVFPCTLGLDPSEGRPLRLEDWPHEGSGQLLGFCALNCYDFCLHSQLQRKHRKNPVSLSASSVAMRSSKESPESPKFFHHPSQLQNIRRKSQI